MYSILIVEDELLVRLGLQAMAQWEKDRFTVAACVGDGQAALEAWRQYRPDIVITDIIMPGLSGLELMRAIRQEGGKCPFIVITAFSHKQALSCAEELSICACLEKSTMTQRDVNSALMLACSKVQEALPEPRKPEDAGVRARKDQAQTFLKACLSDAYETWDEAAGPPPSGYLLAAIDSDLSISPILMDTLLHLLEERFTKNGILGAATVGNQVAMAFEEPLPREHAPILQDLAELRHYTRNNLMLQPDMLIVSPAGTRLPETLLRTMRAWFLAPDRPEEGLDWVAGDQLRLSPLPTEDDFEAWHALMTESLWLLKDPKAIYEAYHAMDLARSALSRDRVAFYKACATAAECVSGIAVAGNANGMDLAQAHLASLRHKAKCPDRGHVGLAVKLLLENLDRDCTLEEAARETGFHSAYFSSLFKQWMGMGYARFGNALRMERAKCLMRENDENVGWVAEQCGYEDITYFSRVFKRTVGVCPSAWRKEEP